jgi:EAL domain-containing protein (putative c-di-GMP-specific phosphodiesterase class I)
MMQLRQLPFTEVKIDRFFVRDMTTANDSLLIVKATIDLAHGLGMIATAEGIETEEQARALRDLGCDVGQGYWIARPLEPDALDAWEAEFADRWAKIAVDRQPEHRPPKRARG